MAKKKGPTAEESQSRTEGSIAIHQAAKLVGDLPNLSCAERLAHWDEVSEEATETLIRYLAKQVLQARKGTAQESEIAAEVQQWDLKRCRNHIALHGVSDKKAKAKR